MTLRDFEMQTVAGRAAKQKQEKRAAKDSNNEVLTSEDRADGSNRCYTLCPGLGVTAKKIANHVTECPAPLSVM